jgi:ligand-binding SRPBCC domain-containing protein
VQSCFLERVQVVPRRVEETFAFFADAAKLEVITPPWLRFRLLTPGAGSMDLGAEIDFALRWRGVPLRLRSRIDEWRENQSFVDRQLRGPYRLWVHRHTFTPVPWGTEVRDRVEYILPLGPLGLAAHAAIIRRDLEAIFDFRGEAVARLLAEESVSSSAAAALRG